MVLASEILPPNRLGRRVDQRVTAHWSFALEDRTQVLDTTRLGGHSELRASLEGALPWRWELGDPARLGHTRFALGKGLGEVDVGL